MSGQAIKPLGNTNHYKVKDIQGCATPKTELHHEHEKRGLKEWPKSRSYVNLLSGVTTTFMDSNNNNQSGSKIDTASIRQEIQDWAFWAAQFVTKDVDIRVDMLIEEIRKVNDLAESNFESHRTHINQLGPNLSKAISTIPATVLQSEEFMEALRQIKDNRKQMKELTAELQTTKEELAELQAQFAELKKLVENIQHN